jgi:hypothetical protein
MICYHQLNAPQLIPKLYNDCGVLMEPESSSEKLLVLLDVGGCRLGALQLNTLRSYSHRTL